MKKIFCLLLALIAVCALASCEDTKGGTPEFAAFSYNGVTIALDAEAEPIISGLGTYVSFAETNSCYGDGTDKVYEYTSFQVHTYTVKGVEYILSVSIFSDSDEAVVTPEGIRIGDSADDVIAKYGAAQTEDATKLVYNDTQTKTRLQFLLRNGAVTNIQYLKTE